MLFDYTRQFSQQLKRGELYWAGETVKKFGHMAGFIQPLMPADGQRFEFGQVIKLDADGNAHAIESGDAATVLYGIVHRNASPTYGVLDTQITGQAPRQSISVFRGGLNGEIAVPLQVTGAVKGGQVYVRIAPNVANPALPIGGIETALISGETVAWVGAKFKSGALFPLDVEKYTNADSPTTAVVVIELT
jgi:hypothetical protein